MLLLRYVFIICLIGLHPCRVQAASQEVISRFDSFIRVQDDGSLRVTETIEVYAAGYQIKRGIYRDFPTKYKKGDGRNVVVGFDVIAVTKDGLGEPYRVENRANGKRVYIGRPEVFLSPGKYTYVLTYETTRQIGFFEDYDELYWNVTGHDWAFPIRGVTATVELPSGAEKHILTKDAYTGRQGSRERSFTVFEGVSGPVFKTTRVLEQGQGLTVVVTWPKGYVRPPGPAQRLQYFIGDNATLLFTSCAAFLVLLYYLIAWYLVGRDPRKGVVIPLFYPPQEMSPAMVRYVRKMSFDKNVFTSAVLQMAVKGALRIDEQENKGIAQWLSRASATTYVLKKAAVDKATLTFEESVLMDRLFAAADTLELDNGNHEIIRAAMTALEGVLSKQSERVYFSSNKGYYYLGMFLSISATVFSLYLFNEYDVTNVWELISLIFIWIANYLFFRLLKAPTVSGRKIMDQIEGFRLFLTVSEKDRLNLLNPPEKTPELFEKYLPYALALEVDQKWSEQFAEVLQKSAQEGYRPVWYSGRSWSRSNVGGFSRNFGSAFASAIVASATPPGSSSGAGGGGSFGGGFSGGGGGGGGGGGW